MNKFVSQLERLFPALGGVNRDHLSIKETYALKAALSGPFGSTSSSWHHVSEAGAIGGFFNNESYVPTETDKFIEENPKTKVGRASNQVSRLCRAPRANHRNAYYALPI